MMIIIMMKAMIKVIVISDDDESVDDVHGDESRGFGVDGRWYWRVGDGSWFGLKGGCFWSEALVRVGDDGGYVCKTPEILQTQCCGA